MATSDAPLLFARRYLTSAEPPKLALAIADAITNPETSAEMPRPPRKAIESSRAHSASRRRKSLLAQEKPRPPFPESELPHLTGGSKER